MGKNMKLRIRYENEYQVIELDEKAAKMKVIDEILIYITDNEIIVPIFEVIPKYRTAVFFYFFALVKMIKSNK